MTDAGAPIGVVAGRGALPLELMREARRQGRRVVCIDIYQGDPQLPRVADEYHAVALGNLGGVIDTLRRHGVREVLLAGKVDKLPAMQGVRLDAVGAMMASQTRDHRDTTILNAFLAIMQSLGFEVGHQAQYLGHLVPGAGVLSERPPTPAETADIETGLRIAAQIAALDIGQALAIRSGAVIAVEAAEGTDAMIRRAGALGSGFVVVKVSRPQQDPRYDLPVIGPETLEALAEAKGTALAVEAGRTLVLDRDQVVAAAGEAGIVLVAAPIPPPIA